MRLALLDPLVALALDPAVLAQVFLARRAPVPFAKDAASLDVARATFASRVKDAVARDLEDLERFGDDLGRFALVEAGIARGRDLAKWPLDEPAESLVARLVVARVTSAELRRVWARARIRRDRFHASVPSFDLLAPSPRAPVAAAAREPRLRATLRAVFGRDLVDVMIVEDEATGAIHAAAIVRGRARAGVALDGHGAIARRPVRELESLRFDYDPDAGHDAARVAIQTRAPERLFALGAAIGEALFESPAYFASKPSFSFKVLQNGGAASVERARLPDGVARVDVVGAQADTLAGARIETRGEAALAVLAGAARGGYFTRTTTRFTLVGEARPVDAFLQLPHRLDVASRTYARLVRRALAALGWMDPGALPDDSWTLAPFAHPEWRWIEILGEDGFRALAHAKLLVKKRGARLLGAELRRLGFSYVTFPVPGEPGVRYALSDDLSAPARDVREEELVVWELDSAGLAERMRRELDARPAERPLVGAMDLGVAALGSVRVRFVYAMRAVDPDFAARAALACTKGEVLVVLVPVGRRVGDGLRHVELSLAEQLGVAPVRGVLARVAEALEIDDAPPWQLSSARVVVERATERVWIDGVLMTALAVRSYKMIECLALAAGRVVPPKEVAEHIAGKGANLDEVARKVRTDLVRRVAESFRAAGRSAPKDVLEGLAVLEGKRGYRLALSAHVV